MKIIDDFIEKIISRTAEKVLSLMKAELYQTIRNQEKSMRYFVTTLKIATDGKVIYRRWLSCGYDYPYVQTVRDAAQKYDSRITIINVAEIGKEDYDTVYSQIKEDEKRKDKCSL